jgi:hypothetical protein
MRKSNGRPASLAVFLAIALLEVIGIFIAGFGVVGLIDPVGAKMSDDADPRGPVTAFHYVWTGVLALVGFVIFLVGILWTWILVRRK